MTSSTDEVNLPRKYILLSSGAVSTTITVPEGCRGFLVGVGGLCTVVAKDGSVMTDLPLPVGITPLLDPTELRAPSTASAQKIWAVV